MTLFENIQVLEPFFHSIRKHQSFFIIDVKLPEAWSYKELVVDLKDVVGVKDNGVKGGQRFLSFFSKQTNEDIQKSNGLILEVIRVNQEREEKERLLQEKIIELKRKFEDSDLDSLKSLHFEYSEPSTVMDEVETFEEEIEDEEIEGTGMAQ